MILRKVLLYINYEAGIKDPTRDNFNLSVNFMNHFLTIAIRKLKYETKRQYELIHIEPNLLNIEQVELKSNNILHVSVKFDIDSYNHLKDQEKNIFALNLINYSYSLITQAGFDLPMSFLEISNDLVKNNFKNTWVHKKKLFKEQNLKIELLCKFDRFCFRLYFIAKNDSGILLNEILLQTLPDRVCYWPLFKDIILENGKIIVTEFQNRPKFILNLNDILNKRFIVEVDNNVGLVYKPYNINSDLE